MITSTRYNILILQRIENKKFIKSQKRQPATSWCCLMLDVQKLLHLFHINHGLNAWNPLHAPTLSSPTLIARIANGFNSFVYLHVFGSWVYFLPFIDFLVTQNWTIFLFTCYPVNSSTSFHSFASKNTFSCVNNSWLNL